jgi:hypothetical protein
VGDRGTEGAVTNATRAMWASALLPRAVATVAKSGNYFALKKEDNMTLSTILPIECRRRLRSFGSPIASYSGLW